MEQSKSWESLNRPDPVSRRSTKSTELQWGPDYTETGQSSPTSDDGGRSDGFRAPPRTPQPLTAQTPRQRHHVLRFWPWEIASFGVAVGLMIATIAILSHYDGQKVPEWPFSINLNTLIALLSTIFRAAMLVVVAEVISQLKWHWFSRPRPLHDLQDFDQASRSVIGSMKLLLVAPSNFLAIVAAMVIIVSLAVGPFTQQAIKTVTCRQEVAGTNASVPVANYIPGSSSYYRIAAGMWEIDVDMKGTMINGITNPGGNDTAIHATCQTGNCTFPEHDGITHSSIGMCSACTDTTNLVTFLSDGSGNYTLPNDLWISPSAGSTWFNIGSDNMTWAESAWTAEMRSIGAAALANVTLLTFTVGTCDNSTGGALVCPKNVTGYTGESDYLATTCSLYPCLKNYKASMVGGVLTEDVVSTVPALPGWNPGDNYIGSNFTALKTPCAIEDEVYDTANFSALPLKDLVTTIVNGTNVTAPGSCLYQLEWIYSSALSNYMTETLFDGYCTYDSKQAGHLYCMDAWWLSPLYLQRAATFDSVATAMSQFATALTNKFRTTGLGYSGSTDQEIAIGAVYETTVCTLFDWKWLLLPIILIVASGVLLVTMMIKNAAEPRQPVWKSSALPLVFYGFSHPQQGPRPVLELDRIEEESRRVKVRFQGGSDAGFMDVTNAPGPARDREYDVGFLLGNR